METSQSWTVDPSFSFTTIIETTTWKEGSIFSDRLDLDVDTSTGKEIESITPTSVSIDTSPQNDSDITTDISPSILEISPSATIPSEGDNNRTPQALDPAVTSLFIYETSDSEVVTRSMLAQQNLTAPESTPVIQTSTLASSDLTMIPSIIPVTVITQSTIQTTMVSTTPSVNETSSEISTTSPAQGDVEGKSGEEVTVSREMRKDNISESSTSPTLTEEDTEPTDQTHELEIESYKTTTTAETPSLKLESEEQSTATTLAQESHVSSSRSSSTTTGSSPIKSGDDEEDEKGIEDHESTEKISVLDLEDAYCERHVCRNGGSCLNTINGPKCQCPLQFRGLQCEEEFYVEKPGFVGHSILVHAIGGNRSLEEGFQMMLSFQTTSEDGLVFYAEGNF